MSHMNLSVLSLGKQKYTKPLYQHMASGSNEVRAVALEMFNETKENLHETVRGYVTEILQKAKLLA